LALSAQDAVDRLIRRLRRGATPTPTRRPFLVVQIDGLSRAVLDEALAAGCMPFLARLLERYHYRLEPMAVGLPTSTAAFHMAAMYGVRPDIPGFHYYDRQLRGDIHFPRPGHAAAVEAKQAAQRRGILHGGSAYGCVVTGSADNSLFTFASLTRPKGASVLNALSAFVVAAWVFVKSLTQTLVEVVQSRPALHRGSARRGRTQALAHHQDRDLGVGAPVLHAGGGPRSLCGGAEDLRELPRLRRLGARLRCGG
jgi:hypothetical protein